MTDRTIIDRLRQANPNFWYAELCHEAADALTAAHAARDAAERERNELRETVKRLNRRAQLAEAAANIAAERWHLRSEHHGRTYVYQTGVDAVLRLREMEDRLTAALQERDEARAQVTTLQWSHDAASLVALHGGIEGIDETMRERAMADPLVAAVLAALGELEDDCRIATAKNDEARAALEAALDECDRVSKCPFVEKA